MVVVESPPTPRRITLPKTQPSRSSPTTAMVTQDGHSFMSCPVYDGYWEPQDDLKCGLHALRAIVYTKQYRQRDPSNWITKFRRVTERSLQRHEGTCQFLDINSIDKELPKYGLRNVYIAPDYKFRIDANNLSDVISHIKYPAATLRGYLVNSGAHWFAIRRGQKANCWYNLDSRKQSEAKARRAITQEAVIRIMEKAVMVKEIHVIPNADGKFVAPRLL